MARIESVNIGKRRSFANATGRTGIYKTPVAGLVKVGVLGVAGDYVADERHHGGPDQAVSVYFAEDYAWWSEKLGRTLAPGTFGENITISGVASSAVMIGDHFRAGDMVLQVTVPRIPCGTLARRMEDSEFVKAFRQAERPGVYCRVIAEGEVAAGMPLTYDAFLGARVGVTEMYRDWFVRKRLSAADLRKTLAAPISERARGVWEKLLASAES